MHLNLLFLLGLALLCGTYGGRLFQKIKIPQVVGYIIIGILIGESGLKIVSHETVQTLEPFNLFALGLIGFIIGGELKKETFKKSGKQFINLLLYEGIGAFLFVLVLYVVFGGMILKDLKIALAFGLLLGAIGSATDPATTASVVKEYKTRGPLTKTAMAIVALDDGLAFVLFVLALSIAGRIMGNGDAGTVKTFLEPVYKISGAVAIGIVVGFILEKIVKIYSEYERRLPFTIGAVLLVTGLSLAIKVDMLLAAMTLGVFVVNYRPRKSENIFTALEGFTAPIYVLFFVLVGAKLNFGRTNLRIALLALLYLVGSPFGKMIGSYIGTYVCKSPSAVKKYLPYCLFPQAGVAIGLSIFVAHYFPGIIGDNIVLIVTPAVFLLQLIGPIMTRIGLTKGGEAGLNITEDDYINQSRASDVMDKNFPSIYKDMPLAGILNIFSTSTHLYYPVIDEDKKLAGVITVDSIKNIFMEDSLNHLLLAYDLAEPAPITTSPDTPLSEVKEILNRYNLEYICVVDKDGRVAGFIERRILNRMISTKLIELRKQADSLDS